MAILSFQKPDKVIMIHSNDTDGQFEFRPLEPGFLVSLLVMHYAVFFYHH